MAINRTEALVSISQTMMRIWHPGIGLNHPARAEVITRSVFDCAKFMGATETEQGEAVSELFRRYNIS